MAKAGLVQKVKERPILFKGELVEAILNGKKTQTRRVMNPQPALYSEVRGKDVPAPIESYEVVGEWCHFYAPIEREPGKAGVGGMFTVRCPYGKPGDRLWTRETFWQHDEEKTYTYPYYGREHNGYNCTKRPSIFMPRTASRCTVEIERLRAERLQDITEEDALAEGILRCTKDGKLWKYGVESLPWVDWQKTARDAFRLLWDGLNARRGFGWDMNHWVWVPTFKLVTD